MFQESKHIQFTRKLAQLTFSIIPKLKKFHFDFQKNKNINVRLNYTSNTKISQNN